MGMSSRRRLLRIILRRTRCPVMRSVAKRLRLEARLAEQRFAKAQV